MTMRGQKQQPAHPHQYGAGTRLSSAYTAGRNGEPHAKHYGGMGTAATKAWLVGHNERLATLESEKDRRANAYPKLVEALHASARISDALHHLAVNGHLLDSAAREHAQRELLAEVGSIYDAAAAAGNVLRELGEVA